jgi:hypothetical protein
MEQIHERFEVKGIDHQEAFPPNALKKTLTLPTLLRRGFRFQQAGMRSESFVISAGRSSQFTESCDEPSPFVDIELYQAFVSHFQQEGLASFLIHDIGAFHDFVDFERLLAERAQDIFSIIQHDQTPTVTKRAKSLRIRKLIFRNYSLNIP